MSATIYEAPRAAAKPGETVVTSTCAHNCGGRCVVNAHVRDGRIVHISTDARRWKRRPPAAARLRPWRRTDRAHVSPGPAAIPDAPHGPRAVPASSSGSPGTRRLDTVAAQMLRIRETYGNAAILDASRTGSTSMLHGRVAAQRFLYMFGGCTDLWSNMSAEAEVFSVRMTYGEPDYKAAGREPTDFVNSRLILMWGWSPGDGTFGTGTMQYLKHAKKAGARIICVDPRVTMTSRQLADEHVFIRPSTDAAALIAMAYVIVSEGLHDQAYCDRHVHGFDEGAVPAGASYRSYLLGHADGQPKTPEWAAAITGISRRKPSGDWLLRSRHRSQRPYRLVMRLDARRSANSSIAPPMRWRRSRGVSASAAATPALATARQGGRESRACPPARTRLIPRWPRPCWRTCWRVARQAATRLISE